MKYREQGCIKLWFKNGEGSFVIPIEYYEDVKRDWMAGKPFFTVKDHYGDD